MKILLINSNRLKQPWPVIPFGLCTIASVLDEAGHDIKFLDLCFERNPKKAIKNAINSFNPGLIGISIRNIDSSQGFNTRFFLDSIKEDVINNIKQFSNKPIVIGGPSVGINAKEMLEFFDLEYAIKGDGENAILNLAQRLEQNKSVKGLEGIVWRKGKEIVQNPFPDVVHDLNKLPIPKIEKFVNIKKYAKFDSPIQVQTKRGCALNCTYCTYNNIEGKHYRLKSPEKVAEEIDYHVKNSGINHIEFTDSCFNIPLEHTKKVLKAILKKVLS